MNKTLNIGHRGAKGHEAENTLASFQKALELGADGIEFDIRLSADGRLIVIHDETVDRTTDGTGRVSDFSLQELKTFRINKHYQIPELSEVFDLVNSNYLINIELKEYETTDPVVALIQQYISENNRNYTDFLISSFDWTALQQVRNLDAAIPLGVLTETDLDLALAFAKFIQAETLHPYYHLLTLENTTKIQQAGIQVFPWTINEPEDLQKIKNFGVNGIITDFPERMQITR